MRGTLRDDERLRGRPARDGVSGALKQGSASPTNARADTLTSAGIEFQRRGTASCHLVRFAARNTRFVPWVFQLLELRSHAATVSASANASRSHVAYLLHESFVRGRDTMPTLDQVHRGLAGHVVRDHEVRDHNRHGTRLARHAVHEDTALAPPVLDEPNTLWEVWQQVEVWVVVHLHNHHAHLAADGCARHLPAATSNAPSWCVRTTPTRAHPCAYPAGDVQHVRHLVCPQRHAAANASEAAHEQLRRDSRHERRGTG